MSFSLAWGNLNPKWKVIFKMSSCITWEILSPKGKVIFEISSCISVCYCLLIIMHNNKCRCQHGNTWQSTKFIHQSTKPMLISDSPLINEIRSQWNPTYYIFYMFIVLWVNNEIIKKLSKLWKNIYYLFIICIDDYKIGECKPTQSPR